MDNYYPLDEPIKARSTIIDNDQPTIGITEISHIKKAINPRSNKNNILPILLSMFF